jgi:KDO2-lipid IV(A) lauroyltransferase
VWSNSQQRVVQKVVSVEGLDILTDAMASQQGLVITGSHIGNWEVLAQWLSRNQTVYAAYKPPTHVYLDGLIRAGRAKTNLELITGERSNVKRMFEVLNQGNTFFLLSDQRPAKGGGVFVPFFLKPAYTMTIIQRLVQKTQSNLIYLMAVRVAGGFKIVIENAPFDVTQSDPSTFATGLNSGHQQQINQYPEQYSWNYRRFRPQPEGFPSVYKSL